MPITDTITTTWSGTGNGPQINSITQAVGSVAVSESFSVPSGTLGQNQALSIAHTPLQEFFFWSDTPVIWDINYGAQYVVTCSSSTASVGDVYTNNSQSFVVMAGISSATTLLLLGTGAPSSSGTLTKSTGAGGSSATIAFSAFTPSILHIQNIAQAKYEWLDTGYFSNPFSADLTNIYVSNPPYQFTVASSVFTIGDTYTNNTITFTVMNTYTGGLGATLILAYGSGAPTATGTLTKAAGQSGSSATIAFTSVASPNANVRIQALRT